MARERKIRICFYEPRANNEHPINIMAASIGSMFLGKEYWVSHCEILFEDDYACSIFAGECVFFRRRTYSNPFYKVKAFTVGDEQYRVMYGYCQLMADEGIPFSNLKMTCAPMFGFFKGMNATFCSELVVRALQRGGVEFAKRLDPSRTTPSRLLYSMNRAETLLFDSTPHRMGESLRV